MTPLLKVGDLVTRKWEKQFDGDGGIGIVIAVIINSDHGFSESALISSTFQYPHITFEVLWTHPKLMRQTGNYWLMDLELLSSVDDKEEEIENEQQV